MEQSEAMDESKFDVDKAVDWFFDHYKDYGIECMPNHVGKIPNGADEMTFNLLDAVKNQQLTNNKYETVEFSFRSYKGET